MKDREKEHTTVSSVRPDVYIKRNKCDDHQTGALRTNLGFIMKKNCAKLDSVVLGDGQ